jgi:uncharacterized protein involved in tolerance to divalent cations
MINSAVDAIVVFITAGSADEAERLANMLVEKRLAACVQILPQIQSIYLWQDKIERQPEILLLVKTLPSKFVELEKEVRAHHSYETPEILAVPIKAGSEAYLEWLRSTLGELGESV